MPHTVRYNPELRIIETVVQGDLTRQEAEEIISGIIRTALETGCYLCLSDYRQAVMKLATMEIYKVPHLILDASLAQQLDAGKFKRAIVVSADQEDFHFFETVTVNSGQNLRVFEDVQTALEWLLRSG